MNWADILRLWRRFAPLVLLCGIAGGIASFLIARSLTPVYETSAVILFSRAEGANLGQSAGNVGNSADASPTDAMQRAALVRSQIEIIKGADITEKVIDRLNLRSSPTFQPQPGPFDLLRDKVERLLGFPSLAEDEGPGRIVRLYLDHLVVRQDPDSYILRVGFRGPDAAEAAAIVNAHVAIYREWLRSQQMAAIEGGQAWLKEAVENAHRRVVAAEAAVQNDRAASMLVSIDGRTSLDQEIARMTTELATAQASLVRSEVRAREIERMQATGQYAALAAMSGSNTIVELRNRFAAADAEAAAGRATMGRNNPTLQTLEASSRKLGGALQSEIQAMLAAERGQATIARDTVSRLTQALEALKQRVLAVEASRTRLASLEGDANTERQVYLSLLQRLRAQDSVAELARSQATLLSPAAVPPDPRSPRLGIFTAFGTLLCGGLAAAGVIWRQKARDTILHTADATEAGLRCLAVMPEFERVRSLDEIDRSTATYSFFLQELRALCATLFRDYASAGQDSVSVLVTSPLPGDGKSTFCHELGRCAAMNGVKTLIVTTDGKTRGRKGATSEIQRLEPGLPLSGIGLDVSGGGFRRRDIRALIDGYQRDFSLVIIDTPPLSATAESALLAPAVDATLVLARIDRTPRSLLARVVNQIDQLGGKLAGLVVSFAQLNNRRGLVPGDLGYYFAQNSVYHQQLASARMIEHRAEAQSEDA